MRLKRDQVVNGQIIQAVRQPTDEAARTPPQHDDVEQLFLQRQILLQLNDVRGVGEKVRKNQTEEPVPVHGEQSQDNEPDGFVRSMTAGASPSWKGRISRSPCSFMSVPLGAG